MINKIIACVSIVLMFCTYVYSDPSSLNRDWISQDSAKKYKKEIKKMLGDANERIDELNEAKERARDLRRSNMVLKDEQKDFVDKINKFNAKQKVYTQNNNDLIQQYDDKIQEQENEYVHQITKFSHQYNNMSRQFNNITLENTQFKITIEDQLKDIKALKYNLSLTDKSVVTLQSIKSNQYARIEKNLVQIKSQQRVINNYSINEDTYIQQIQTMGKENYNQIVKIQTLENEQMCMQQQYSCGQQSYTYKQDDKKDKQIKKLQSQNDEHLLQQKENKKYLEMEQNNSKIHKQKAIDQKQQLSVKQDQIRAQSESIISFKSKINLITKSGEQQLAELEKYKISQQIQLDKALADLDKQDWMYEQIKKSFVQCTDQNSDHTKEMQKSQETHDKDQLLIESLNTENAKLIRTHNNMHRIHKENIESDRHQVGLLCIAAFITGMTLTYYLQESKGIVQVKQEFEVERICLNKQIKEKDADIEEKNAKLKTMDTEMKENNKKTNENNKVTERIKSVESKKENKLIEQRKHIQYLEKKVNNLSKKYDELQDECVICQEYLFTNRYEEQEKCLIQGKKEVFSKTLACKHTQFHKQCLTDWFGNHQRCPLCNIKAI